MKLRAKTKSLSGRKQRGRSESRIKLACYIWMGLSSKQIAKLLMIEPMSVMKSRYRLRQQMNLAQGESLEQALSKLE